MTGFASTWDGERCQACGAPYDTVYWLPDDVWAAITPAPERPGGGLLCWPCAFGRMTQQRATPPVVELADARLTAGDRKEP